MGLGNLNGFAVACHSHRLAVSVRHIRILLLLASSVLAAAAGQAQTLTIYDEALVNTFENYSYATNPAPLPDFNSSAQAHGGSKSIAFTGTAFNAVGFHYPDASPNLSTATYPVLRFWVNGGAGSGQKLRIYVASDGIYNPLTGVVLDSYITGGSVGMGVWREVVVNLSQGPFNAVTFDRIDIQSDQGPAQPTLYIDDVTLGQTAAQAVSPMTIEHGVTVASMVSDRFTWKDSSNQPRVAVLAHNDGPAGPGGAAGGALREFRYQLPNGSTRIANVTTYGNGGYAGFGYVVSHASRSTCVGDDSPLGGFFSGTWAHLRGTSSRHLPLPPELSAQLRNHRRPCADDAGDHRLDVHDRTRPPGLGDHL